MTTTYTRTEKRHDVGGAVRVVQRFVDPEGVDRYETYYHDGPCFDHVAWTYPVGIPEAAHKPPVHRYRTR